jgi:hypothetical protein
VATFGGYNGVNVFLYRLYESLPYAVLGRILSFGMDFVWMTPLANAGVFLLLGLGLVLLSLVVRKLRAPVVVYAVLGTAMIFGPLLLVDRYTKAAALLPMGFATAIARGPAPRNERPHLGGSSWPLLFRGRALRDAAPALSQQWPARCGDGQRANVPRGARHGAERNRASQDWRPRAARWVSAAWSSIALATAVDRAQPRSSPAISHRTSAGWEHPEWDQKTLAVLRKAATPPAVATAAAGVPPGSTAASISTPIIPSR